MNRHFVLVCLVGLILSSCDFFKPANEKIILIGPGTQPCVAGVMETDCMQIKWSEEQSEWENYYGQVEGFTFEKGYEYELIVREKKTENTPADANLSNYELVKEVSKRKVELPDITYSDNSKNSLDWDGTYEGVLPCADCEGIKTTITLKSDGSFDRSVEYLGKNGKPVTDSGKFEWDKNGSVISLIDKNTNQKYQVGENQIIHLDQTGNKIKGSLAEKYILVKKTM